MKRFSVVGLVLCLVFLVMPSVSFSQDLIAEGDAFYALGGMDNYQKSMDVMRKAVAANPGSFEANWKLARAIRWYAEEAKRQNVKDWDDICKKYGKEGMNYAEKAMALNASKPDGYYWYGLNVGIYADGVSILTALAEGLKDKTQSSFEKVYAIDKSYDRAGAILSLARFWSVLPWPLKDNDKSIEYFKEYGKLYPDRDEYLIFYTEVLYDEGGSDNKAKAKELVDKVMQQGAKWRFVSQIYGYIAVDEWAARLKKEL